jgi:tRNA A-37 threonylcarbamoyl transferase component Bud32
MAQDEDRSDGEAPGGVAAPGGHVDPDAATRIGDHPIEEAETVIRPRVAHDVAVDGIAELRGDAGPRPSEPGESASPGADVGAATRVAPPRAESPAKRPPTSAAPHIETSGVEPGSILFGEYEIVEVLGAGGMGEVYRARHRRLGEFRAIKMMHADLATRQGANEFFLREAKALLAVRHPAVVHCHDLLSDERGRVYLVMEMIEGISLSDRLVEGPLPADEVVMLGARLAAGLEAAHARGVVHRDLSPDNVVLPGGRVEQAKLIDFGIAKILEEGQGTIIDGFKGKLGFASPEQLGFFGGRIDGRSDFYSLGLVLIAAVLGRPMGMGTTVVEAVDARRAFQRVPDEIPVGLRSTIEPLLALDPDDRPRNVEPLFVAPAHAQREFGPVRSGPAKALKRGPSGIGGIRVAIAAAAIALGVGGYWVSTRDEAPGSIGPSVAGSAAAVDTPTPVAAVAPIAKPVAPTAPVAGSAGSAPVEQKHRLSALENLRIVGLLRGAETALAENRLQSPKGDNAYEKYREVLKIDPDNQSARKGLVAVAGRYLGLAGSALSKSDLEQARTYLARASAIAPHHPDLDAVRSEVETATMR